MRILLTNDDGIHAPGLAVLERIAAHFSDDIWICAPDEEQSGAGHSLTLTRPVRLKQHGPQRFSVTGTPTDAVTMALKNLLPAPPDLILSGVNRGANLGDDVTYSGTVAAAFEGALAGIRSIALSQVYRTEGMGNSVSFQAAEIWGERALRPLLDAPFQPRTLVNINFPPLAADEVRGIRVVRQGFHDYARGSVVEGTDPRGFRYFWFGLHGFEQTPGHASDLEAIADGYISVTPLQLDFTHEASLAPLAERYPA
jgi:5'-nucleotidase